MMVVDDDVMVCDVVLWRPFWQTSSPPPTKNRKNRPKKNNHDQQTTSINTIP